CSRAAYSDCGAATPSTSANCGRRADFTCSSSCRMPKSSPPATIFSYWEAPPACGLRRSTCTSTSRTSRQPDMSAAAATQIDSRRRSAISVFEQFRAFWKEVEAQRTAALAPAMAPAAEHAPTTTAIVPASTATRERLLYHLRGQQADMARWATGPVL